MELVRHIEAPLRLFSGAGALDLLGKELSRAKCKRAVVVCGRSLSEDPAIERLRDAVGGSLAGVCIGVKAHSPRAAVEAAAAEVDALDADALIAVGGGSAMVTARAIAILLAEGKPLGELCTRKDPSGKMISPRLDAPKLPIFAVPTTPSTAVIKPGTAVYDEALGERLALFDPKTRPEAIFLDPEMLGTAPERLVDAATLNTLCTGIEGLATGTADALALANLVHAVRLCMSAETRVELALAAILCGRGTDHTGMGLATVISHALAKAYGVDGGIAKAASLPHVLTFNWDHIAKGREALSLALSCPEPEIIDTLSVRFETLAVPRRLRELGVSEEALPEIAGKCMGDWFLRTNPRPVNSEEDLIGLLRKAL